MARIVFTATQASEVYRAAQTLSHVVPGAPGMSSCRIVAQATSAVLHAARAATQYDDTRMIDGPLRTICREGPRFRAAQCWDWASSQPLLRAVDHCVRTGLLPPMTSVPSVAAGAKSPYSVLYIDAGHDALAWSRTLRDMQSLGVQMGIRHAANLYDETDLLAAIENQAIRLMRGGGETLISRLPYQQRVVLRELQEAHSGGDAMIPTSRVAEALRDFTTAMREEPSALTKLLPVGVDEDVSFSAAKAVAVDAFERTYLIAVLARNAGNISAAAREAGVDRSNFRRILIKHGLHVNVAAASLAE